MNWLHSFRSHLNERSRKRRYSAIYQRFQEFTMIPAPIYADNLRLAEQVSKIPGCIVECGVWRGGMSAGLVKVLGPERDYFLLDSFEGLPLAKDIDGQAALDWQNNIESPNYYDNCSATPEFAQQAMNLAGARSFQLVKGWFDQTLPTFMLPSAIALLRLDADWYESTTICLQHLFDKVMPGGLIILDDYYAWDGCSKALHDFLSCRSAAERIQSLGEICYLKKRFTQ